MKQTLFVLFLVISMNSVSAQNSDCKVLLDSLKGTYEGECSNGKASGKGKAVGVATYDGDFKNGLPDGLTRYYYLNGELGRTELYKDGKFVKEINEKERE